MSQLIAHLFRNGDLAAQNFQRLDMPEEDQVVEWSGIRDGAHSLQADAIQVLHLTIELLDGYPVVDAMVLEEAIKLTSRGEAKHLPQLSPGHPARAILVEREDFEHAPPKLRS